MKTENSNYLTLVISIVFIGFSYYLNTIKKNKKSHNKNLRHKLSIAFILNGCSLLFLFVLSTFSVNNDLLDTSEENSKEWFIYSILSSITKIYVQSILINYIEYFIEKYFDLVYDKKDPFLNAFVSIILFTYIFVYIIFVFISLPFNLTYFKTFFKCISSSFDIYLGYLFINYGVSLTKAYENQYHKKLTTVNKIILNYVSMNEDDMALRKDRSEKNNLLLNNRMLRNNESRKFMIFGDNFEIEKEKVKNYDDDEILKDKLRNRILYSSIVIGLSLIISGSCMFFISINYMSKITNVTLEYFESISTIFSSFIPGILIGYSNLKRNLKNETDKDYTGFRQII